MKPIWEEAIKAVRAKCVQLEQAVGQQIPKPLASVLVREITSELLDSVSREIEKRLEADPPPEVEAFSWTDAYGNLQVRVKALSTPEAFPPSRADKKLCYWLIEIPEPEKTELEACQHYFTDDHARKTRRCNYCGVRGAYLERPTPAHGSGQDKAGKESER